MMQILNLNTKTTENKHFIHYVKRFPQTLSVCFFMPTSKHNYPCFLIVVQSFSASTFSRIVDCFQNKLSSVWSYIFLFNWPRQEANTKQLNSKIRSQEFSPTKRCQRARIFLARCHRDFALIGYCALLIVFSGIWLAQISCPIFLKLDSFSICKRKSYLNYPN